MNTFERAMLWGSAVLVGGSGGVYAVMKYLMTTDDPYAVVNHPLQPLVLKIHIVSAPLLVFAVGVVFVNHIREQWRAGLLRGRVSGAVTMLTFVPMVLSGYLIQAVTDDGWLLAMVWVHAVTGVAYIAGFLGHQVAIRLFVRRRRAAAARRARAAGPSRVAVAADPNDSDGGRYLA